MRRQLRIPRLSTFWLVGGVSVAGLAAMAGCGNQGEGTVTVSAESRARIEPHAGPNAKDKAGHPLEGKPLSAKQRVRGKAAAGEP